jgi:hypothetical protein
MPQAHPLAPQKRKRPSWVLPVAIIVGVIIGMLLIAAVTATLLVAGLRSGAEYLNGAPITVNDETVEGRAVSDMKPLLMKEYASFESNINLDLDGSDVDYRDDLEYLQQGEGCNIRKKSIFKRQGGFDNGASIRYKGRIYCSDNHVYDVEILYTASALGKKDAADINRFRLFHVVITSDNQQLIEAVSKVKGQFVSRDMSGKPTPLLPNDTRTFTSYSEYQQALKNGDLAGCTQKEAPKYTLTVQVSTRSSISRSSGTAVVSCG